MHSTLRCNGAFYFWLNQPQVVFTYRDIHIYEYVNVSRETMGREQSRPG